MRDQQRQSMSTRSAIARAIDALRHDPGYALRGLRRSPGLTLAMVRAIRAMRITAVVLSADWNRGM